MHACSRTKRLTNSNVDAFRVSISITIYECHTNRNSGNCSFLTKREPIQKCMQAFELMRCSPKHKPYGISDMIFLLLFFDSLLNQIHINKCIWGTVNTNKPLHKTRHCSAQKCSWNGCSFLRSNGNVFGWNVHIFVKLVLRWMAFTIDS